jgi:hypothetical protein
VDVRDFLCVTDPLAPPQLAARCARHAEAPAEALCSRCGDQLCRICLPPGRSTCGPCGERDPFHDVVPLAWERNDRGVAGRLLATLGALLFTPWSRAPAFARGEVGTALGFALRVTLPLACLSHVVPVTRTLLFGPSLSIELIGQAQPPDVAVDVIRAMAAGLLLAPLNIGLALLGVLLASGFRDPRIWLRHALYWSWLEPAVMLIVSLIAWGAPSQYGGLVLVPMLVLPFAWWWSLLFTARRARRIGWAWALLTALVGGIGWTAAAGISTLAMAALNPDTAALREPPP